MKWYFAINQQGTGNEAGALARLAVRSARKTTNLEPYLLYRGERSQFTAWMEDQGVTIIDVLPQYETSLQRAITEGWYPSAWTGHWLRTEICNVELEDEFVLYTDVDVIFLKPIELSGVRPRFFACAPEMNINERAHFNTGVMVMNVPALRADYPRLRAAIEHRFSTGARTPFHDQTIYNSVYHGLQDQLDPIYNWKPYWPANPKAAIFHFHGPKLNAIEAVIAGTWSLESEYGLMVGRLLGQHLPQYVPYLEIMRDMAHPGDPLRERLEVILRGIPTAVSAGRSALKLYDQRDDALPRPTTATAQRPDLPPERLWRQIGQYAWERADGRAFVTEDAGRSGPAWTGALRLCVVGQPSPKFLADHLGRVRAFASAEDAMEVCDATLTEKNMA
jgi:hypothetical protein